MTTPNNLIEIFARHRVAPNLLMVLMVLAGLWALNKLNVQFFPNFTRDVIMVQVIWTGASAEDIESGITIPLEQALRNLDGLDEMSSSSTSGISTLFLEYKEGSDMSRAIDRVNEQVSLVRDLPDDAELPEITYLVHYELVARILLSGSIDTSELRRLAHRMQRELLDRGLGKVMINGQPNEEIVIQVPSHQLRVLGLSLEEIANRIVAENRELPAGTVGRDDAVRELRSPGQQRTELCFEKLPVVTDEQGRWLTVGDIATVVQRPKDDELRITFQGQPAIELIALRTETSDALKSAQILERWVEEIRPTLPPSVKIHLFDQRWQVIQGRISLLLKNGLIGLLLVTLILFIALNSRVAWWVAIGIPTSFFATLGILYVAGGTINMMSLFGLILVLGIIVDDAIVVGENAYTRYQNGQDSSFAVENGAKFMLAPVISSSLTTIASFLPLMLVTGIIGNIFFDIPFVVICAIIASLVECFLVLPGHLRSSLSHQRPHPLRIRIDRAFTYFQNRLFRPFVRYAVNHGGLTMSTAIAILILCFGLLGSGKIGFSFFPPIESNVILASASFVSGTPAEPVERFVRHIEETLEATEAELGLDGNLIDTYVTYHGIAVFSDSEQHLRRGDAFGSLFVELIPSDARSVRTETFMRAWEEKIRLPAGIENFTLAARRDGHPGSDIEIRLKGETPTQLKSAAEALKESLHLIQGVSSIDDDIPYGLQQLIYQLTPQGEALGLSTQLVGSQLRAAFDGYLTQVFHDGYDEVEVRVMLPDDERRRLGNLKQLHILTPNGIYVPLESVVTLTKQRGFETLSHDSGDLVAKVTANVDYKVANANRVRYQIAQDILPNINHRFDVQSSFIGRASDQDDSFVDMKIGTLYALAMIYIVLAWVFSSYGKPLVVMSVIPFGVVGGILGHWLMGIDLTVLSLFGLLGLSGIVVNDSIILVTFYQQLRSTGLAIQEAIVEAACQRLRAVLLTSITTIAGLTPLLFEDSFQAQFLIPMAVSISFGLGFATFLVLLVVPTILSFYERLKI